jgi:hypothetical protein
MFSRASVGIDLDAGVSFGVTRTGRELPFFKRVLLAVFGSAIDRERVRDAVGRADDALRDGLDTIVDSPGVRFDPADGYQVELQFPASIQIAFVVPKLFVEAVKSRNLCAGRNFCQFTPAQARRSCFYLLTSRYA